MFKTPSVISCASVCKSWFCPFAEAVIIRGPSDLSVQRNSEGRIWCVLSMIQSQDNRCRDVQERSETGEDGERLPKGLQEICLFEKEGRHQPSEVSPIKQLLNVGAVKDWDVQEAQGCATHCVCGKVGRQQHFREERMLNMLLRCGGSIRCSSRNGIGFSFKLVRGMSKKLVSMSFGAAGRCGNARAGTSSARTFHKVDLGHLIQRLTTATFFSRSS